MKELIVSSIAYSTGLIRKTGSPMPTVGLSVREIRIHEEGEYRVLYLAKFAEAVYVQHAFSKKTRKTPRRDIDLAGERFRAVIEERKRQKR